MGNSPFIKPERGVLSINTFVGFLRLASGLGGVHFLGGCLIKPFDSKI
jgi:hypothetical protein